MAVIEAEDAMKDFVPDDRVYDVVLAATGSEERASAALTARLAERLRRNEKHQL